RFGSMVFRWSASFEPTVFTVDDASLVNLSEIITLEGLGIVKHGFPGFSRSGVGNAVLKYFGQPFVCARDKPGELSVGNLMLTTAGKELLPISGAVPNFDYMEKVLSRLRKDGFDFKKAILTPMGNEFVAHMVE